MNTQQKLFFEELQLLMQKHNLSHDDVKNVLGESIPYELYLKIRGISNYSAANGGTIIPIEPKIDLQVFYNYIKSNSSSGFRIYPAFESSDNNLYFMLAKSEKEIDPSEKFEFFPFIKTDYLSLELNEIIKNEIEAKNRLQSYFNNVKIEGSKQLDTEIYKKSRYYSVAEFETFLTKNQITGNYSNYYVKIEFGYITAAISKSEIWIKYPNQFTWSNAKDIDHLGFTCIFTLFEKTTNIQKQLMLEIGHPCPPQCGSLKW